jgi:diadenosine tetraphosphatase ApaH/serine/threonine PP2A family protein phosphatase
MVHAGVSPAMDGVSNRRACGRACVRRSRAMRADSSIGCTATGPISGARSLRGMERLRFAVNALTRMRVCTADGRIDVKMKGPPDEARLPYRPWFEHEARKTRDVRVIFGHWSALGLVQAHGVLGLDTGCVWGGALTAAQSRRGRTRRPSARLAAALLAWAPVNREMRSSSTCRCRAQAPGRSAAPPPEATGRMTRSSPRTSSTPIDPGVTRNATRTGHCVPPGAA